MNPVLSILGQWLHLEPDLQLGDSFMIISGPIGNFAFIKESLRFLGLLLPYTILAVNSGLVLELLPSMGQCLASKSLIGGFDALGDKVQCDAVI